MAKTHQRIFALGGALLFFLSSIALTAAVLWQIHQSGKNSDPNAQSQTSQTNQPQEGKLEGTKLEGFTPVAHVDKLETTDITPGTGDVVKEGDTITVHYTGALAKDGTIFQSSHDSGQPIPLELKAGGVIEGWVKGVPGMKVGGKRRLLIPAAQGYGAQAQNGIPANSDLVFDVEVVKIGQ